MRSHRRAQPLVHALVAGGVDDLPGMVLAIASLPSDAYGQVLVEAERDADLSVLNPPARLTVQRIDPTLDGAGVAMGRALDAWVAEWVPDEIDERRAVTIWIGSRLEVTCPEISGVAEPL